MCRWYRTWWYSVRNVSSDWHGCPPCFLRTQRICLPALGTRFCLLCTPMSLTGKSTQPQRLASSQCSVPSHKATLGQWLADEGTWILWSLALLWDTSEGPTAELPMGSIVLAKSSVAVIVSAMLYAQVSDSASSEECLMTALPRNFSSQSLFPRNSV